MNLERHPLNLRRHTYTYGPISIPSAKVDLLLKDSLEKHVANHAGRFE
jgi:hypothetical protein